MGDKMAKKSSTRGYLWLITAVFVISQGGKRSLCMADEGEEEVVSVEVHVDGMTVRGAARREAADKRRAMLEEVVTNEHTKVDVRQYNDDYLQILAGEANDELYRRGLSDVLYAASESDDIFSIWQVVDAHVAKLNGMAGDLRDMQMRRRMGTINDNQPCKVDKDCRSNFCPPEKKSFSTQLCGTNAEKKAKEAKEREERAKNKAAIDEKERLSNQETRKRSCKGNDCIPEQSTCCDEAPNCRYESQSSLGGTCQEL